MDEVIETVIEILKTKGEHKLAELLVDSSFNLIESSSYGTRAHSVRSTAEIYSSPKNNALITNLNEFELNKIKDAIYRIYPIQDDAPEIDEFLFKVRLNKRNSEKQNSKNLNWRNPSENIINQKEIFISYSWDSIEHENKVSSFTKYLRERGFNAEIDKMHLQSETALDFSKMMHRVFTDYKKVIIVLSKGYKIKAEKFEGGVGNEYSLIIKDINENPTKYILVSFEGISNDIVPIGLKNRDIVNLAFKENEQKLFSKLSDKPFLDFGEVSPIRPEVILKQPSDFVFQSTDSNPFNILRIINKFKRGAFQQGKCYFAENTIEIEIENTSNRIINDYTVEIIFPVSLVEHPNQFKNNGENVIITYNSKSKLYPTQTHLTDPILLKINYLNLHKARTSKVKVNLFSESGFISKEFPIISTYIVSNEYGNTKYLEGAEFHNTPL